VQDELRERVLEANRILAALDLAHGSYGNVSEVDRDAGVVAIKPSGVPYDALHVDDIAVVSLEDGERLAGLKPSSDTPTHLELYRAFGTIGGIAHTHSTYATSWAQAKREIPCLGTTHADDFHGAIPCTRELSDDECGDEYERVTGVAIVEAVVGDPLDVPAVLVSSHGPFAWGTSGRDAVAHAETLEQIAHMALNAILLGAALDPIGTALHARHFRRKHGPAAYYGQR
jgi:L-ribulose-5-phosphate 4-epimerase